jgi:hypothetical protein
MAYMWAFDPSKHTITARVNSKAFSLMDTTLSGITAFSSRTLSLNASHPIVVTFCGMTISLKPVLKNAEFGISVMLSGSIIFSNALQTPNISTPSLVTVSANTTSVNL